MVKQASEDWGSSNVHSETSHERDELGVPVMSQQLVNPTNIHEDIGWIPGLIQWLRIPHCCGYGVGQQLQFQFDPRLRKFHTQVQP